jgi:hypothetical protein
LKVEVILRWSSIAGEFFDEPGNDRTTSDSLGFGGKGFDDAMPKHWFCYTDYVFLSYHVASI